VLTVRELLRDLDVRLLTGEAGLDAPVRWVHISELDDPTPWLSGGELLLTTGLPLATPQRQREFIDRLADHQLAGLGLGTGFSHPAVPPALVAAAAERDFPVFEVPYEVPFIAVTEKAFTRLVNEQYAVLRRAIAAHERLERLVLSERGIEAVMAALSTLIGGAALVFDARGDPLAQSTFRRPLDEEAVAALRSELRARVKGGDRRGFIPSVPELAGRSLALPVASTGTPEGSRVTPQAWLVAAKDGGGLTEFDRLTLHQAVTIVALEFLRRRVVDDTERRLAGDVLSELASGELAGPELARRLEPFGVTGRVSALVLARSDVIAEGHLGDAQPGLAARRRVGEAEAALTRAVRDEALTGLVAATGAVVCALLAEPAEGEELVAVAERLRSAVAAETGATVRGGVGRAVPAIDARQSLHEARWALEARALSGPGANGHPPGELATHRDLGSFQLLLSLQDDDALRLFCDSILGPIEGGEGYYGGELMRSLEAFIEENGQWERAARRLYCHRHTLRYRIRKIEELTGRDLSSARNRIEFWLALRGRELVRAPAGRRPGGSRVP
jgi:PucR family transcriptional regulator, purine catabolism regulatory protein